MLVLPCGRFDERMPYRPVVLQRYVSGNEVIEQRRTTAAGDVSLA